MKDNPSVFANNASTSAVTPLAKNPKNLSHVPCKFYKQGACQAGNSCPFSHNLDIDLSSSPCKYFQKGNCKFGLKCALAHILPDGRRINTKSTNNNGFSPLLVDEPRFLGQSSPQFDKDLGTIGSFMQTNTIPRSTSTSNSFVSSFGTTGTTGTAVTAGTGGTVGTTASSTTAGGSSANPKYGQFVAQSSIESTTTMTTIQSLFDFDKEFVNEKFEQLSHELDDSEFGGDDLKFEEDYVPPCLNDLLNSQELKRKSAKKKSGSFSKLNFNYVDLESEAGRNTEVDLAHLMGSLNIHDT